MGINWKQNQPIVIYIRVVLVESFPFFTRLGYSKHWSGMGAYVDRTARDGGASAHAQGRAMDIYLSAFKIDEKRLGDGLFTIFGRNLAALGVDHVIWNRQIWSLAKGGPRPYKSRKKGPHTNHVHVAFTRVGSQKQPALFEELVQDLRERLDGLHYVANRQLEHVYNSKPEEVSPYN